MAHLNLLYLSSLSFLLSSRLVLLSFRALKGIGPYLPTQFLYSPSCSHMANIATRLAGIYSQSNSFTEFQYISCIITYSSDPSTFPTALFAFFLLYRTRSGLRRIRLCRTLRWKPLVTLPPFLLIVNHCQRAHSFAKFKRYGGLSLLQMKYARIIVCQINGRMRRLFHHHPLIPIVTSIAAICRYLLNTSP